MENFKDFVSDLIRDIKRKIEDYVYVKFNRIDDFTDQDVNQFFMKPVRKWFFNDVKRLKFYGYQGVKYFCPSAKWLVIWSDSLEYKDKWNTPRHEQSPIFYVSLFGRFEFGFAKVPVCNRSLYPYVKLMFDEDNSKEIYGTSSTCILMNDIDESSYYEQMAWYLDSYYKSSYVRQIAESEQYTNPLRAASESWPWKSLDDLKGNINKKIGFNPFYLTHKGFEYVYGHLLDERISQ